MLGKLTAITVAAMLLATGCSGADADETSEQTTTTLSDTVYVGVDGVEASIADTSRIVSLNGGLTETIFALGDRVVGIDLTTTYPPEAAALPDVGLGRLLNA